MLADLAVTIADRGDALAHLKTLRHQHKLLGTVASDATMWRMLDRVDDDHLTRLQTVRAAARERAWAAGAGPDVAHGLVIDIDATVTLAHSEKDNAAKTWKKTFGFHPLPAYLDRPDVAGGEALAAILAMALSALPEHARPDPEDPSAPRVTIRIDSVGAIHAFARAIRVAGRRVGHRDHRRARPDLLAWRSRPVPGRWSPAVQALRSRRRTASCPTPPRRPVNGVATSGHRPQ